MADNPQPIKLYAIVVEKRMLPTDGAHEARVSREVTGYLLGNEDVVKQFHRLANYGGTLQELPYRTVAANELADLEQQDRAEREARTAKDRLRQLPSIHPTVARLGVATALLACLAVAGPVWAEEPAPVTPEQFNARRVELYQAISNLRGQLAETASAIEGKERELADLAVREQAVKDAKRGGR